MPPSTASRRFKLHAMASSGNCYKVELVAALLNIPLELHEIDILKGESHTPEFLRLNPNGRVPLLQLPDGRPLAESNAILLYLARDSALVPADPYDRALVHQWLFFEQYSHEPFIATNRFWLHLAATGVEHEAQIQANHPKGLAALEVMEQTLATQSYLTGSSFTVADIALYAYTHVAPEGGYDLGLFPAVQRWLERVAAEPGYIPMRR